MSLRRCIHPTPHHPEDSDREIMYRAGQRSVVEYIKQKLEQCVAPLKLPRPQMNL